MKRDYYRVLDLEKDASADEVQRAYRTLALRYHPDRNSAPDALLRMTAINEAYEVLGDPGRRRDYDGQEQRSARGGEVAGSILSAAREAVMRSGWTILHTSSTFLLVENGGLRLRIAFIHRLNNAALSRICRQYTDCTVVLAVEIETPINLGLQTVVVDLMHSKRHGNPVPEAVEKALRSLLAPFL